MDKQQQVIDYLESLGAASLRKVLLEAAFNNAELWKRLLTQATAAKRPGLRVLEKALRHSLTPEGDFGWADDAGYADRVEDAVRLLDARIEDGDPALVELIEALIDLVERSVEQFHESSGLLDDAILALHRTHLDACAALHIPLEDVGRALFRRQLEDRWGFLPEIIDDYFELIGEAGQSAYWRAAFEAWEALPALEAGDRSSSVSSRRHAIEAIVEGKLAQAGDLDALIRAKARNLSRSSRHLELAKLCREHGRLDEAIRWAEEGFKAFPINEAYPLEDHLIELYRERGDYEKTETVAWQRFKRLSGCNAFFDLLEVGKLIGKEGSLRERALGLLWSRVKEQEAESSAGGSSRRSALFGFERVHLVGIHREEGDDEAIWAVFCGGPVSVKLWQPVAAIRGRTHPDEAIALYRRLLPHVVEAEGLGARYDRAFEIVAAIRQLRIEEGQLAKFQNELREIRSEWKRKRNFMKRLNEF
ncbi:MAG: hypothetical protein JSR28_04675 [Proteobacteria bacterium]|nr:hypothetical protein [Pseudomonadota bacterium]